MRMHIGVSAVFLMLLLSACTDATTGTTAPDESPTPSAITSSSPRAPTPVSCPATPLDVVLDYQVSREDTGEVFVAITTNLPETTELVASFHPEGVAEFPQISGDVRDSKVTFGPFMSGAESAGGKFELTVAMSRPDTQPSAVIECVGAQGEFLTGALIVSHGVDRWAAINTVLDVTEVDLL